MSQWVFCVGIYFDYILESNHDVPHVDTVITCWIWLYVHLLNEGTGHSRTGHECLERV